MCIFIGTVPKQPLACQEAGHSLSVFFLVCAIGDTNPMQQSLYNKIKSYETFFMISETIHLLTLFFLYFKITLPFCKVERKVASLHSFFNLLI